MAKRRSFLKLGAVVGALVLGPVRAIFDPFGISRAAGPGGKPMPAKIEQGELWAGFRLLPWGTASPPLERVVQMPAFHGPGTALGLPQFESVPLERLARRIGYPLPSLPKSLVLEADTEVLSTEGGKVIAATTKFYTHGPVQTKSIPAVVLRFQPDFPSPLPVWPFGNPDTGLSVPERVNWLPRQGLVTQAALGPVAMWIDGRGLHTVQVDSRSTGLSLRAVAASIEDTKS